MDIYNKILNMSYFKSHELLAIISVDWNVVRWWAIMTEQPSESREVFLLTKWPESFSCYLLTPELIKELNVFLSHSRNNPIIYSGNCQVETNQLIFFVITFGIYSLCTKLTKPRSAAADHMTWVISDIIYWNENLSRNWTYFVSSMKNPIIYRPNRPLEPNQMIHSW